MATSMLCDGHLLGVQCKVHSMRQRTVAFRPATLQQQTTARRQHSRGQQRWCVRAAGQEGESSTATEAEASLEAPSAPPGSEKPGDKVEVPDELQSEADRKATEVERLRAAEKFMKKGTGEGECQGCGYSYTPKEGDDEYPVPKGTRFEELPGDWQCPVCGAPKNTFQTKEVTVAGFAQNQKYGLGSNSMTEGQKSLLIFGSLGFFFVLFLLGYLL